MIHLLHFADVHLGMENYGRIDPGTGLSSRLVDFLRALDTIVDYALEHGIELAIFAGDAYKSRDPSPTHQREFARRIRRLSAAGIPTFLLVGNHDLPNAPSRAHTIEIFDTLGVDNVIVAKQPGTFRIETGGGPVQIVALPWVTRSALLARDEYKNKNLAEINAILAEKIELIISGEIAALDPEVPSILVAHGSVFGAQYGSERSVMLGHDVLIPRRLVTDPAWDYVALGHIHRHQVVSEQPPVVYSGSIERIDFGEEREDKGFVVAEVERGHTRWEFVPLAARPLVTIEVEATDDDPTGQVLAAIAGRDVAEAVVRVIIHTTADKEPLLRGDDVRRALAGAFHVAAVVHDVERTTRLRLGSDLAVEAMLPGEILERYLRAKQVPPERVEVLLRYAQEIFGPEATS